MPADLTYSDGPPDSRRRGVIALPLAQWGSSSQSLVYQSMSLKPGLFLCGKPRPIKIKEGMRSLPNASHQGTTVWNVLSRITCQNTRSKKERSQKLIFFTIKCMYILCDAFRGCTVDEREYKKTAQKLASHAITRKLPVWPLVLQCRFSIMFVLSVCFFKPTETELVPREPFTIRKDGNSTNFPHQTTQ